MVWGARGPPGLLSRSPPDPWPPLPQSLQRSRHRHSAKRVHFCTGMHYILRRLWQESGVWRKRFLFGGWYIGGGGLGRQGPTGFFPTGSVRPHPSHKRAPTSRYSVQLYCAYQELLRVGSHAGVLEPIHSNPRKVEANPNSYTCYTYLWFYFSGHEQKNSWCGARIGLVPVLTQTVRYF